MRAGLAEQSEGTRRTITAIRLLPTPSRIPTGQAYVHRHETRTNPPNVYELRHIEQVDYPLFITSITDCLVIVRT